MEENNKYQQEEKFLAFIDILGFKEIINNDLNPERIMQAFEEAKKDILELKSSTNFNELNVTWFSDSLVISISNYGINAIEMLISMVRELQSELLIKGILIRGAISKGNCYHEEKNVFGKAMVQAYELESKLAVTPRVIISKEVESFIFEQKIEEERVIAQHLDYMVKMGFVNEYDFKYNSMKKTVSEQIMDYMLTKDMDGNYFIDYLRTIYEPCIDIVYDSEAEYEEVEVKSIDIDGTLDWYKEMIVPIRKFILNGINNKDIRISLKYIWLKNYYNKTVDYYSRQNLSEEFKANICNKVMEKI